MTTSVSEKIAFIEKALSVIWPNPKSELNFESPFQLLVATIMAAQATDKRSTNSPPYSSKPRLTPRA